MAAGPLLAAAVPEVAPLAPDASERAVAEPILLDLRRMDDEERKATLAELSEEAEKLGLGY